MNEQHSEISNRAEPRLTSGDVHTKFLDRFCSLEIPINGHNCRINYLESAGEYEIPYDEEVEAIRLAIRAGKQQLNELRNASLE